MEGDKCEILRAKVGNRNLQQTLSRIDVISWRSLVFFSKLISTRKEAQIFYV